MTPDEYQREYKLMLAWVAAPYHLHAWAFNIERDMAYCACGARVTLAEALATADRRRR